MIVAYIFVNIIEIQEFFGNNIINDLKNIYWINIFKIFLQGNLDLLKGFIFNNRLVLIKNKFGYYFFSFIHCFIKLFF